MTDSSFLALLRWVLEWWLGGQDPGLAVLRRNVEDVTPVMRWTAAAALAVSLVVTAALLAVRRRGTDLADAVVGVGRFLLILSGGWLLLASMWAGTDALARWIVGPRAASGEYVGQVAGALAATDPAIARTMSIAGTSAVLSFVAVVVVRVVLAVVVAVGIPIVAAVSLRGRAPALRLVSAWLVAVLAFQPLAALVYRVGHDLVTSTREPVMVLVVVCLTFLLSAALLPGVARIVAGGRA